MLSKNLIKKLLVLFLLSASIGCIANSNRKLILKEKIQVKLDSLIRSINAPGGNLSIILPDGDSLTFSSGYSDLEKKTPMTPMDKMLSGSIGKTYVAAIAFQLIQEKKLNLNDKVLDLLKEEKWIAQIPNIKDLTVEMLLSHTSGLPRYEYYDEVWTDIKKSPNMIWSVYDRMKYILNATPIHPAGKSWAYSDSNYILMGAIIEKITGKDYYDSFITLISNQPSLKNTVPAKKRQIKGLASGYTGFLTKYGFPEKISENEKLIFNPQMEWCGGGVASTATDLARWVKLLYEDQVIALQSIQKMVTPTNFETDLPDGAKYGLGAIIYTCNGTSYWGHQGFFPGYRSIVQYSPRYKFSIALQINRDNPTTKQSLNLMTKSIKDLVILYLKN
jgi:D-alanyl-D-alanine carboxypeptidase